MRLTLGYGIAVAIGLTMGRIFSSATAIRENSGAVDGNNHSSVCGDLSSPHGHAVDRCAKNGFASMAEQANLSACGCGQSHTTTSQNLVDKAGSVFIHAMDDFLAVGHYLVIGAFIAALA